MFTPQFSFTAAVVSVTFLSAVASGQTGVPRMEADPTVHDPSVIRVDERYYVFGSHLQAAETSDLMNWTQVSGEALGNTLVPGFPAEFSEALEWSETDTLWAPDVARLEDGRYYMYYCASAPAAPRASIGLAVADAVEGPYSDLGIFLQSGMWDQISPDGTIYDANVHPNTIDPHVFFDAEERLWMVYGSYSGGIFILQLDRETGLPLAGQGYGTKLIGGFHARIEGPYILYHPESEYYYLFLSYGGLAADGGYNIRLARSREPEGPYLDASGTDMTAVAGTPGQLFDDSAIAPHGVKLMGNARFLSLEGEPSASTTGYVSPGHNSAYYDAENGKTYLFFHTRFVGTGELHEVRVHQLHLTEDDWLVVAPHRYGHETIGRYQPEILEGRFKVIFHGKDITATVKTSTVIELHRNGTVTGNISGSWELTGDHDIRLTLGGVSYRGVVSHQWDDDNGSWVMTFSALSPDGAAFWGSEVASARSSLEMWRLIHFGDPSDSGDGADAADPDGDGSPNLVEYALRTDPRGSTSVGVPKLAVGGNQLVLEFERIMDPSLTYSIEASDALGGAETIWSSSGDENLIGPVAVDDPESIVAAARRFLRLRVER